MTASVLSLAGKVVDLSNEVRLIGLLGDVADKVEDLREKGLTGSPIESLLKILRAPNGDPQVTDALKAVGLDGKTDLFAKLSSAADRIEKAGGGFLLERMSNFVEGRVLPTRHDWELLDIGTETSLAGIGIDLKAKPALRFAALPGKNPFADEPAEDAWTFSDTLGEYLLTVTANGAATAAAKLSVPFKFGTLGVAGSADGKTELAWLFDPPDAARMAPVAAMLAQRIASLPNPFSLQSISAAMDDGDLVGLRMRIGGETEVAASVTIGYSEELAPGLKLTGGAEVSATSRLASTYHLTAKAERPRAAGQGHAIRVKVSRNCLNEKEIEFGLGVELDMAGLTNPIREIVMAKAGLLAKELEAIRPFLSPGTWARKELKDQLTEAAGRLVASAGNTGLMAALEKDIAGLVGIGRAGGVTELLEGQLASQLDRAGAVGEKGAEEVARHLMGALPRPLAALANEAAAKDAIQTELVSLIKEIRDKLEAKAKALTGAPLRKLSEAIEKAGAKVGAGAIAGDNAAAGLRKLLGNIETLVEKIAKEAENPLRTQVKLKIAAAESRYRAQELQLEGVFSATNEETKKLYREIWTGDWKQLSNLFTLKGVPGFDMQQDTSSLVLTMGSTRAASVHAVVFGFGMEFTARDMAQAEVEIDGFGNITVLAKAEVKRHRKLFGEAKGASFASALAIAAMANGTSGLQSADMGFAFESKDRRMSRTEARNFLLSLDDLAMIGGAKGSYRNMIDEVLDRWFGSKGGSATMDGLITCRVTLETTHVRVLRDLGYQLYSDPLVMRPRIVARAIRETRRAHSSMNFDDALAIARRVVSNSDSLQDAELWLRFMSIAKINSISDLNSWIARDRNYLVYLTYPGNVRGDRFREPAMRLVRAALVPRFLDAVWRTIDWAAAATPQNLKDVLKEIWAQQRAMTSVTREWLVIGPIFDAFFRDKVSGQSIAFVLILNDLLSTFDLGGGRPFAVNVSLVNARNPEQATSFSFPISGVAGGGQ
jgi:hypothetical protein